LPGPHLLGLGGNFADLLGRFDVAAEEDDSPEIELARERAELDGEIVRGKAADEKLSDAASWAGGMVRPEL